MECKKGQGELAGTEREKRRGAQEVGLKAQGGLGGKKGAEVAKRLR